MGDGRYYTIKQFTNVSVMMVLIMVMTVNLVGSIYQHGARKRSRQLLGLYVLLFCGIGSRYVAEVIVDIDLSMDLIRFSGAITLMVWTALLIIIARLLLRIYRDKAKNIVDHTLIHRMTLVSGVFVTTCAVSLAFLLSGPTDMAGYWFLIQYGGAAYIIDSLIRVSGPYVISPSLFTKTKNMLLDFVFIIDGKGNLIYQSNHSYGDDLFSQVATIDPDNVKNIFSKPVENRRMNGNDYILISDSGEEVFLSYARKPLMRKGKRTGEILTFSDVSGLVRLLSDLKKEQADTEKINEELQQYAKIVYSLEKEQEIQLLLEDIAENQEGSMLELKKEMEALEGVGDDVFMDAIKPMIQKAKENLASVRQAVSTYKAYFGGKND